MKKWQTLTATALLSASLAAIGVNTYHAIQPTHYQGETFVNEKKQSTKNDTRESTSVSSSSSSTASQSTETSDNNSNSNATNSQPASVKDDYTPNHPVVTGEPSRPAQLGGTIQPESERTQLTFYAYPCGSAETTQGRMEVGIVTCGELQQATNYIPMKDCYAFRDWMTSVTQGKVTLDHSLQENLDYWYANVKGQQ